MIRRFEPRLKDVRVVLDDAILADDEVRWLDEKPSLTRFSRDG